MNNWPTDQPLSWERVKELHATLGSMIMAMEAGMITISDPKCETAPYHLILAGDFGITDLRKKLP